MVQSFTAIITSDRYSKDTTLLDAEREILAGYPDLDVDLRVEHMASMDDLVRLGNEADALFTSTRDAIPADALEQMHRLKVIARYGVGLDNIDLDAAADRGIVVTHYPQYCTSEVADHTVSLILALNRRLVELNQDLRAGAWQEHGALTRQILRGPIKTLRETTVGMVALGRIGEMIVNRLRPFGINLIVSDPYIDVSRIEAIGGRSVTLDELVAEADTIVLMCPLTPETRGLLGSNQFAQMKPDVAIVNTSRGPVIDQAALIEFLQANPGAQAGLDVFEEEPLPLESPLYHLPNVILTPHSAYYSERSVQILRDETFRSAIDVLRGIRPPTVANPSVLDKVHLQEPES
jgi:D-3-phosphoglycerate dehydrogenase / 2-oxoglutarate reductase